MVSPRSRRALGNVGVLLVVRSDRMAWVIPWARRSVLRRLGISPTCNGRYCFGICRVCLRQEQPFRMSNFHVREHLPPNLAVNTDAPCAALRAGRGSPVTLVR